MKAAQRGLIDARVALVEPGLGGAEGRAAIAHEVFGAGQHAERIVETRALEAADGGAGEFTHELGIFGEAFIGAAPADVLRYGDAGTEGPLNSRRADLFGGDALHLLDQLRVARAAQADIVREDHRVEHVVVPVYGVDAVEDRDLEPGVPRTRLQTVVEIGPGLQAVAFLGVGTAAAEQRTDEVLLDVGRVLEFVLLGLSHLADLLLERHLRQEGFSLGIVGGEHFRFGSGPAQTGDRNQARHKGEAKRMRCFHLVSSIMDCTEGGGAVGQAHLCMLEACQERPGVRGLSAGAHRTSKACTAREGMNLSDFLKRESELCANRPRISEWLDLTRNLKAIPATRSGAQIVRELRDSR